jgi:TonB family protein
MNMMRTYIIFLSILGSLTFMDANAQICPDNNHPHMIDLGLPTGTLWACCNIGATKPEGYGSYFAWGETEEKDVYNEKTYRYTISEDGPIVPTNISGTKMDVAYQKWGSPWRLPDVEQSNEFIEECKYQWMVHNGIKGGKFTGPNGNSIFFPAAGYREEKEIKERSVCGNYWTENRWSSTLMSSSYYTISFSADYNHAEAEFYSGQLGYTVRPIAPKGTYDDSKIYDVAEEMPEFPGGMEALMKFLQQNLNYPTRAKANGIQGRVMVTFVVEKDGSISNQKVKKAIDEDLDREALRICASMPKWNPGRIKGKAVRVKYTVPITFHF